MKPISLTALKQGIQRLRTKGAADPGTLFELENGYVAIDGSIKQRPGTQLAHALPAGTIGMCSHAGELVVFSTSPKACPAGVRCEVLTHPFFPSQGLVRIWFAAPFLGHLYVVAEFANGDVYHYWLQAQTKWKASTMFTEGQIVVPTVANGLGYKAHRVLPKLPPWATGIDVVPGTSVEPTTANGYYYRAFATSEAAGVGTPVGSPNPDGGTVTPPGGDGGTAGGIVYVAPGASGLLVAGYVGVPYSNIGMFGDPWADKGNKSYRRISGDFWPGATVNHKLRLIGESEWLHDICGIPLTAGTHAAAVRVDTGDGFHTHSQNVVIAAKPSFAVLDFSGRLAAGVTHTGASPAFTGVKLSGGSILDCAGWTAGKIYAEINVTALTSLLIGVHGAALSNKAIGGASTLAYLVAATGVHGLAFDTATGNLWVRNAAGWIGGGDPAAGTSPTLTGLTASVNGRFRFGLTGTATAQANFGNAAWTYAVPTGFAGVAMPAVQAPVLWDIQTLPDASRYVLTDFKGRPASLISRGQGPGLDVNGHVRGTIGKSADKWQVGFVNDRGLDGFWCGLALSTFSAETHRTLGGELSGGSNSIGIRGPLAAFGGNADPYIVIQTNFGSVHTRYLHPRSDQVGEFTVAADFTAGTVAVYADGVLLRTLTGVPAGTYFPAATLLPNGSVGLVAIPTNQVAGFTNWTTPV